MKKNVLLYSHELKIGGAPSVLCQMGKVLETKYNVVVLSPSDGVMRQQFEQNGMEVIVSGEITDALRALIVEEFEFVVANTILALPFVMKVCDAIPIYWWIHESSLAYEGRQDMGEYYQIAAQHAKIFSAGYVAADNFFRFYGIKTKILEFGLPDSYVSDHISQTHEAINIICPSTICELKGQDILVQAIQKMKNVLRNKCTFIFLGELRNDNQREYKMIEELTKKYHNVRLISLLSRDKLLELYYDMDIIVAPSREDATPATIVEGLMYHKVCICSDGTGISRYIKDDNNGYVFKNADSDDLKDKLEYVVDNFNDLGRVREQGRKIYETIYDYDVFAKKVLEQIGRQ
ncbi:MAG: glycosyltransferase family 4 protein [Lachnospiraceae bacterium]|nr:glycosyltransferase family 4 protein [Lachnospiraceae bacterium]